MYFYVILFFWTYTWKFWGSLFSSLRGLRVLGSLRFRDTLEEVHILKVMLENIPKFYLRKA